MPWELPGGRDIGRSVAGCRGPAAAPQARSFLPGALFRRSRTADARAAGRDPGQITRIAQLVGAITDHPGPEWTARGADPVRAGADQ